MVRCMKTSQMSWWQLQHTGGSAPDAVNFAARCQSLGPAIRSAGGCTLLVTRGDTGPKAYVSAPHNAQSPQLAGMLANAVGAKHVGCEAVEVDLSSPVLQLVARPSADGVQETQSGSDPVEVAAAIARALEDDQWFAVTLREPTKAERTRCRAWFKHRTAGRAVHYANAAQVVVVSFTAGGAPAADTQRLLETVASLMPGFDIETKALQPGGRAPLLASGAGLAGLGAFSPEVAHYVTQAATAGQLRLLAVPGLAVAAVGASGVTSDRKKLHKVLDAGHFPTPRTTSGMFVSKPRAESTRTNKETGQTQTIKASSGSYPLHETAFLVGPAMAAALACPHYGTAAGATAQRTREVPPALTDMTVGPHIGVSNGTDVHLSSADLWAGAFISGAPGSGKSETVHNIWGYECMDYADPSGRTGHPGRHNTMVAFESKSADGVRGYQKWLVAGGVPAYIVDMADPASLAIDMLGSGSVTERVDALLSQLVYAFGEDSIGPRSQMTLRQVFAVAMQLTDDDAAAANMPPGSSFMDFAGALLQLRGDEVGKALYESAVHRSTDAYGDFPGKQQLVEALTFIAPLYGQGVTPSQRRGLCEAPQSKVMVLLSVPSWWSPSRARIDFATVLDQHVPVIINTGPSLSGQPLPDDQITKVLSSMLLHSLRRSIQTTCGGWRKAERAVTIYSDELSLLAGSSGDILEWMRNMGREFGVRLVLATQFPEQLEPKLRTTVMGFATLISGRQTDPGVLGGIVASLNRDGSSWTESEVSQLPNFESVVQASVGGSPLRAVSIRNDFWGEDTPDVVAFRRANGRS